MKATMVIPSYWRRKKEEGWEKTDDVYDHPTPLDEEGTLARILNSLSILQNKDFNLVVLGVASGDDLQNKVEDKISSIIKDTSPEVDTFLFSYSHLNKIHQFLTKNNLEYLNPLLQLKGYSNIRNLCTFLPHLLSSDVAVLIDDDEIFEDPCFMDKAFDFIGQTVNGEEILAVAGFYINPDNDFLLNKEIPSWMTYWNKIDCMNRAFKEIIGKEPRLKETPFAFGGNLIIHRELFSQVPFDPHITRGEDIDFLINSRMFGFKVFLDNQLSIKHEAPPKTFPTWQQVREDIFRFVFEKGKLDTQESLSHMNRIIAQDLDPYPGEFLKEELEDRIFRSNQMLAVDYISKDDKNGALECINNIHLAQTKAVSQKNPFHGLLELQKNWEELMKFFSSEKRAQEVAQALWPNH